MPRSPVARLLGLFLLLALLSALFYASRTWWLTLAARPLVWDDPPCRADAGLVLAGDYEGTRIRRMAELIRQDFVPYALLTGGEIYYGRLESDLIKDYTHRLGYPDSWFVPLPAPTASTCEEIARLRDELRRRSIHSLLVVTSNYHTARTRRTIRRLLPELQFCIVAAPDPDFSPAGWWQNREGRKLFFLEWMKTLAEFFGL